MLADRVEDHVVRLAACREVLSEPIVHGPRTERPHELDVFRVAHGRHVGLEVVCEELHRARSDRPGGAVDEDALACERLCRSEGREREQRAVGDGRRLLEPQVRRLQGDHAALRYDDVLRVRATRNAEYLVADTERLHGRPDVLDLPRELGAVARPPRPANAREDPGEAVLGAAHAHRVAARHRGGVDPDEHLVVLRHGSLDVRDAEHVRRSVAVVDDSSHAGTSSRWIVR